MGMLGTRQAPAQFSGQLTAGTRSNSHRARSFHGDAGTDTRAVALLDAVANLAISIGVDVVFRLVDGLPRLVTFRYGYANCGERLRPGSLTEKPKRANTLRVRPLRLLVKVVALY